MYLAKDFNIRLRIVPKVEEPERSKRESIHEYLAKHIFKFQLGERKKGLLHNWNLSQWATKPNNACQGETWPCPIQVKPYESAAANKM